MRDEKGRINESNDEVIRWEVERRGIIHGTIWGIDLMGVLGFYLMKLRVTTSEPKYFNGVSNGCVSLFEE